MVHLFASNYHFSFMFPLWLLIAASLHAFQDITVCSGVIITFRHIITAASCLDFNENGLKTASVSEFKIYGGTSCLYIDEEDEELYDNVPRFKCPNENENSHNVASIKPLALLVPMSSIISNIAH
ncbi:unnamed protein product, partial [Litomosoides sigmodontis]